MDLIGKTEYRWIVHFKRSTQHQDISAPGRRGSLSLYLSYHSVEFTQYRPVQWFLKPLFFEVPQNEGNAVLSERQWVYSEIVEQLLSDTSDSKGIIINGTPGSGKTTIMLQIVGTSCFGPGQSLHGGQDRSDSKAYVGSHVVAYHFCQVDNSVTCRIGEWVHSLAAQLSQSPCMTAYHQLLSMDHNLRTKLSLPACTADPNAALIQAILAPLSSLRKAGKIRADFCLILIDALCDSQFHRPDYGDTLITFIAKHLPSFPSWLKLVLTIRADKKDLTKVLPFPYIRYLIVFTFLHCINSVFPVLMVIR